MHAHRVLVVALALVFVASVQVGAQDSPPIPVAGLAQKLAGADLWYGMHMGTKSIGSLHFKTEAAGPDGVKIRIEGALSFGPAPSTMSCDLELGPDLSLRALRREEDEQGKVEVVTMTPAGEGKFTRVSEVTRKEPGAAPEKSESVVSVPAGTLPWELYFLVFPRVDWQPGTTYAVAVLNDSGSVESATGSFLGADALSHRGTDVAVANVRLRRPGKAAEMTFSLSDGRTVQAAFSGPVPMRIVAGTREQAGMDLPDTFTPDQQSVRDVVLDFFRGIYTADGARMTKAIDFPVLQQRVAEKRPEVGMLKPEAFQSLMVEGMLERAPKANLGDKTEGVLEGLSATLSVSVEGDRATVVFPGKDQPFHLERREGVWRIVYWEPFAGVKGK